MVRSGPVLSGRIHEDGVEGRHRIGALGPGECSRFAIVAEGVGDLEIEWGFVGDDAFGERVTVDRPWVLFPAEGPLCPKRGGEVELVLRTYSGAGTYSAAAWRFP
jgi:hypothetical protein